MRLWVFEFDSQTSQLFGASENKWGNNMFERLMIAAVDNVPAMGKKKHLTEKEGEA